MRELPMFQSARGPRFGCDGSIATWLPIVFDRRQVRSHRRDTKCPSWGLFSFPNCFCYVGIINHLWSSKVSMMPAQLSRTQAGVPLSVAAFCIWLARAKPGERFEYYRGRLGIDRVKGTSSTQGQNAAS
jgi:hypothetical protein